MNHFHNLRSRLLPKLATLYGSQSSECLDEIVKVCDRYNELADREDRELWNERDVVLIAYPDQVSAVGEARLRTLGRFLKTANLHQLVGILHILPFFPSSSDDGFSVIDYRQVENEFGTWGDIDDLGRDFDLMFDLVLNHASANSEWCRQFSAGNPPYSNFFAEATLDQDLSQVIRPRSSPLLTPVETSRGPKYVWSTFSSDQFDLNFREPKVLVEILDTMLFYAARGARIIRLDAVAYLWKEPGTSCIHLPQTHLIVEILRDVVDEIAPGTLILTETNVPHDENISYWGQGNEAHLIYNFSLPPLLLDALIAGDARFLNRWLRDAPTPPPRASILNFTASHDGIGVRPLESLIPDERFAKIIESVYANGGAVSQRLDANGELSPYELNITYFDALKEKADDGVDLQIRRFLASQALTLALRGIPAVYFHSLFAIPNYHNGVARTGMPRSINRQKFSWQEINSFGGLPQSSRQVFNKYQRLLAARIEQPAFHPDGSQAILETDHPALVAFIRTAPQHEQQVLVIANLSGQCCEFDICKFGLAPSHAELINRTPPEKWTRPAVLDPYQVVWLPVTDFQR